MSEAVAAPPVLVNTNGEAVVEDDNIPSSSTALAEDADPATAATAGESQAASAAESSVTESEERDEMVILTTERGATAPGSEDDESANSGALADGGMQRVDSFFFSPKNISNETGPSFPVVQDEVTHELPKDLKTFFSSPAKHNKYLSLIQTLLRPPQQQQQSVVASSSPTTAVPDSSEEADDGDSDKAADVKSEVEVEAVNYLDKELVMQLCADVTATLKEERSLLEISIERDDHLVIVGDVHGQLHDMTHHVLNQQYEKPPESPDRKFLFLGDYVDRGPQGVEIILLLFALKIEYPNLVYLLRGNHEESQTSRIYGFLFEVRNKYNDLAVWAKFNEVFCYLPLAAVVSAPNHRLFAVHGGLSPTLSDVGKIAEINREDYGGMLDSTDSDIVDGLLWSDPSENVVRFSRNERGCGYLFGPAAANDFCDTNNLDFICRAHQMTMQGYSWMHGNKVLTVFSAPNYCGVTNNLAAILIIDYEWKLNFVRFSMAPNRMPIQLPPTPQFGGWSFFQ